MTFINFLLQGFGFDNSTDFKFSTFKYIISSKVIAWSVVVGFIESFLQDFLGLPLIVFSSFVLLNILEFHTGIKVAKRKKKNIESRKMGRMFLKVGVYLLILFMLKSFMKHLHFPQIMDYELDPFIVMYWAFLSGVIYQLFRSLLENLVQLGYKEANGILGYITRKIGKEFPEDQS